MKIPLFIPGYKKSIVIEKKYTCDDIIIPIGSDCHATMLLKKLHLRTQSLPFDWVGPTDLKGLYYVSDNLVNNFKFFLAGLHTTKKGNVVAERYPFSDFYHERDIAENQRTQKKFQRRIDRFLDLAKNNKIRYFYTITSFNIRATENITEFVSSVHDFLAQIKPEDSLHMYIRYDESFDENKSYCDDLFSRLQSIDRLHVQKNIRYLKKHGTWGNEKEYTQLMSDLKVPLKSNFLPIVSIQ